MAGSKVEKQNVRRYPNSLVRNVSPIKYIVDELCWLIIGRFGDQKKRYIWMSTKNKNEVVYWYDVDEISKNGSI